MSLIEAHVVFNSLQLNVQLAGDRCLPMADGLVVPPIKGDLGLNIANRALPNVSISTTQYGRLLSRLRKWQPRRDWEEAIGRLRCTARPGPI